MADFEVDISRWVDKATEQMRQFPLALSLNIIARLQAYTPVLTGRLRSSWGVLGDMSSFKPGDTISIGTNVVYARRIEYGFTGEDSLGRHYHQRGAGMVARVVSEMPEIVALTIAQLQGGASAPPGGGGAPSSGGSSLATLAKGTVIGATEGAAEGAIVGAFGGPLTAGAGALIGAAFGFAEALIVGDQGGPVEGAAVGAIEGGVIAGPAGAAIGALEGGVEGYLIEDDKGVTN